jgi:hypothetical protein
MIDRRELLVRASAALGWSVSAAGAAGVLAGCAATPAVEAAPAPRFLTAAEARDVAALADRILPRTDTPGAVDVGVSAFIDRMLADYYPERERMIARAGLAEVAAAALARHRSAFADLSEARQVALMTEWDRQAFLQSQANAGVADAPPHFFRLFKELTTLGFFTSEIGATQVLRYEPVPGPWRADVPYSEIGRAWAV